MKKQTKIGLMILIVLCICFIPIISKAAFINVNSTWNKYKSKYPWKSENAIAISEFRAAQTNGVGSFANLMIYCIEHGKHIHNGDYIQDMAKTTRYTKGSSHTLPIDTAYILSTYEKQYKWLYEDSGVNMYSIAATQKEQYAVWRTSINIEGSWKPIDMGEKLNEFAQKAAKDSDKVYNTSQKYKNYANAVKNAGGFNPAFASTSPKMKVSSSNYIIGPFKLTGYVQENTNTWGGITPNSDNLKVLNQNGKEIGYYDWVFSKADGTYIAPENIKPGSNFYIKIPVSKANGITSIKLQFKVHHMNIHGKYWDLNGKYSGITAQKLLAVEELYKKKENKTITSKTVQLTTEVGGTVWNDAPLNKGNTPNGIKESGESGVAGVTVTLYNGSGKVASTTTSSNGVYQFKNLPMRNDYYIIFTYDGMTYKSTTPVLYGGSGYANNSKAAESSSGRTAFNNKFAEIAEGQARNPSGTKTMNLTYTKANHASYVNHNSNFLINASTKTAGYTIPGTATSTKNINLGLVERNPADLAVMKDLQKMDVTINGKTASYAYDKRSGKNGYEISVKYSDVNYYGMTYSRGIYRSDYNYRMDQYSSGAIDGLTGIYNENAGKTGRESTASMNNELRVFATYKISVRNQTNVLTQIKELIDYQDSDYNIVETYAMLNGTRYNITWTDNAKYGNKHTFSGYTSKYTRSLENVKLKSGDTFEIYIKYEVNKDSNGRIIMNGSKDNLAEISSYATYNTSGAVEGVIDRDSAPANARIGDKTTYEDDTDYAPPLTLKFTDKEREASGFVWEDTAKITSTSGGAKVGDGARNSGEPIVNGITIQLIELRGSSKYLWKEVSSTSSGYKISSFIPGNFMIRFKYGDTEKTVMVSGKGGQNAKSYNGQDYKSTVFQKGSGSLLSDAKDDYTRRVTTNTNFKVQNNKNASLLGIINKINNKDTLTAAEQTRIKNELIPQTYQYADTNGMSIEIENPAENTKNIDLGLVQRPKAQFVLSKEIKELKLTLEDGTVLIDASPDRNVNYVKWIAPSYGAGETVRDRINRTRPLLSSGIASIEIDNELMQGATLEVRYRFTVSNTGEVDYDDQDFYYTGIVNSSNKNKMVASIANTIVDYVSNNLKFNPSDNPDWSVTTQDDLKSQGLVDSTIDLSKYQTIIKTDKLGSVGLKPRAGIGHGATENDTKASVELVLTKVIATEDGEDDLTYENIAEIVKTTNPVGRRQESSILGNHDPNKTPSEIDSDKAQEVTITPPTGQARIYYILGLTLGIVLIVGIVFIQKKVLKGKKRK